MENIIRIKVEKYGGALNYEWDATFLELTAKYLLVKGEANRQLIHHRKGKVYICENPSIEYFPFGEWFTVSIEKTRNNQLNCYCNISMPPSFSGDTLTFIDLDLDIVRRPNEEWRLVDEDEFLQNSRLLNYPQGLISKAEEEARKLMERIRNAQYPFDGWLASWLEAI